MVVVFHCYTSDPYRVVYAWVNNLNGLIVFKSSASACFTLYKSHRSCRLTQKSSDISKSFANRNAVLGVTPRLLLMISLTR